MLFKDQELIAEAYQNIVEKQNKKCKCNCKVCKCNDKKKDLKEGKKAKKPDYLDVDKDGNKKEPMKKALKDKKHLKEQAVTFKELFNRVVSEAIKPSFGPSPYSNTFEHDKKVWLLRRLSGGEISEINDEEQYIVSWKEPEKHNNQKEQPLKGESVHAWLNDINSLRRAFPEE